MSRKTDRLSPSALALRLAEPRQQTLRQHELLIAAGAILLAIVLMTMLQYTNLRHRFEQEGQTQARIVAQNTAAALVFDAPRDAQEVMQSFAAAPAVQRARLLRRDGSVMSTYVASLAEPAWALRIAGSTELRQPITVGGQAVGTLEVQVSRAGIWREVGRFALGGLVVAITALTLFFLGARRLRAHAEAAELRSQHLIYHDALTDLPNRAYLRAALAEILDEPDSGPFALMLLDVDDFTRINALHGPAAGDLVLRDIGLRLRSSIRPEDVVARVGGDEYAVLLTIPDDRPDTLENMADSLMNRLRRAARAESHAAPVNVSAGLVVLPRDATTPDRALQCADEALRQAKADGKDGFKLFSPSMGDEMQHRLSLEADARQGVHDDQFLLHYQPVYDHQERVASLEALMRWQHPEHGLIPPGQFIPMAESTGLIVDMGMAILRRLRRDLDAASAQGLTLPVVAVNLSANQFRREDHQQRFLQLLDELALGPDLVEFELTETIVFEDLHQSSSIVRQLQDRGYRLDIDDFGTGYSSLNYLRLLKAHKLKIDQSFVQDLGRSEDALTLVKAMVDVGHAFKMVIVAEGVETVGQRALLHDVGCDLLQGYLLSRPLPPEVLIEKLGAQAD